MFEYNYVVESISSWSRFWICILTTYILGMGHGYTESGSHSDTLRIIHFAVQFPLVFRHWTPCLLTHVDDLFFTTHFDLILDVLEQEQCIMCL
jgi:hypothetical protein